ncbi:MAG: hypothetical protein MI863_06515 [Desulfobacterales bacterium]|nr:hypothetical protein [Desulfobacterales bacterium]
MTRENLIGHSQLYLLDKFMKENGLSQRAIAKDLDLTRQYFNLIVNRNKGISQKTADKLSMLIGYTSAFWKGKETLDESMVKMQLYQDGVNDSGILNPRAMEVFTKFKKFGFRELVDKEIQEAAVMSYITIDPFDPKLLESLSYRLRGETVLLSHIKKPFDLDDSGLTIQPGQKVAIMTKEFFKLPPNVSARVSPTTQIIDDAVTLNSGFMVHPGFRGKLYFTLNNLTAKEIHLEKNIEFIRIKFTFSPIEPERVYDGKKQGMTAFLPDFIERFCDDQKSIDETTDSPSGSPGLNRGEATLASDDPEKRGLAQVQQAVEQLQHGVDALNEALKGFGSH